MNADMSNLVEPRYIRGSQDNQESVIITIFDNGCETTCIVNAYRLIISIRNHPCGNGKELSLDDKTAINVLTLIQKERNAIKYSGKLKTLDNWYGSGLDLNDFLAVCDKVDERLVDQQLDCLPPHVMKSGYFQVGEAFNEEKDENGKWRATWSTFVQNGPNWTYCGHCFSNDTVNRVEERDKTGAAIQAILDKCRPEPDTNQDEAGDI